MIADISLLIFLNLLFYGLFCLLIFEFVRNLETIQQTGFFTKSSLRLKFLLIAILIVFNGLYFGLYSPNGSEDILKDRVSLVIFLLVSYLLMERIIHIILSNDNKTSHQSKLSLFIIILLVGSVLFSSQSSTLMNQNEKFVRYNPYEPNYATSLDWSSFAWVRTYRDSHYLFIETFKDNELQKDIFSLDKIICPKIEETNITCKIFFSDQYDFSNKLGLMFSQDNSHLFIYNFGYIIDFDVNFKSFQILNYNYYNNNYDNNLFSINSALWQIKVSPIIDTNTNFLIELFNLDSNSTISFDISVPSLNARIGDYIYAYISSDFSNLFFEVWSNESYLVTFNSVYVKLNNFQQKEIAIKQINSYYGNQASFLGWVDNQSTLYLRHYIGNNSENILVFNFWSMNYKSYDFNNTGTFFLDTTGKYLDEGSNFYQVNSGSITLTKRITKD